MGVAVYVGEGVFVAVGVVVGDGVMVDVCEGVNVGEILAVSASLDLRSHRKPPPKPTANRSNPKGTKRINQRRMISIPGVDEFPRK